jgi:hypothetical protein
MVPKNVLVAVVCATCLGWSGLAAADQYQPDQFFGLDLSKAVLSPKPLGPPTQFAPVAVEAKSDHAGEAAQASAEPKAEPRITMSKTRIAHRAEHPHGERAQGSGRTRLARRQGSSHGNPLDAQAFDTRIQVWPCKSGGICNWQH